MSNKFNKLIFDSRQMLSQVNELFLFSQLYFFCFSLVSICVWRMCVSVCPSVLLLGLTQIFTFTRSFAFRILLSNTNQRQTNDIYIYIYSNIFCVCECECAGQPTHKIAKKVKKHTSATQVWECNEFQARTCAHRRSHQPTCSPEEF